MDVVDSATRSRMMSGIRGSNTTLEVRIRSALHRQGFRYRLHVRNLPGKPDMVFPRHNAVIFVHGCFWHGHDCPLFKWPSTRPEFWRNKIGRNQDNDQRVRTALVADGWRVGVVWECAIRGAGKDLEIIAKRLGRWLRSKTQLLEERG